MTRTAFAHDAVVVVDGDPAAPGGAITVALCGHWDHQPPCPLAPHHTATEPRGDGLTGLRVLFVADAEREAEVRALIDGALRSGSLVGPDGRVTTWSVRSSSVSDVRPAEARHAEALLGS